MINITALINSKYLYLLATLVLYFVASPLLIANQLNNTILSVIITLFIVLCINVINRNSVLLMFSIMLGTVSMICHWLVYLNHANDSIHLVYILSVLSFLMVMTFFVITSVAKSREITGDSLLGAIAGYFLIGLTWSVIYLLIEFINSGAIHNTHVSVSMRDHIQQMIYFSFVTLTTIGYGDILPVSDLAKTMSWLEAVTGQIYLAVWISQLVGLRIAQVVREEKMNSKI